MDRAEKALAVAAGAGLLMEVKEHFKAGNSGQSKVWPGVKVSFFSSVMLWMLYKWYKKQQIANVKKRHFFPKNTVSLF
jgi:hypothetical protein